MLELRNFLQTIRVLSLGGLAGAAFGILIYFHFRPQFGDVNPYGFICLCGALGTALQNSIRNAYRPLEPCVKLQVELFELSQLRKRGRITQQTYQKLVNRLVERRFLDK